MINNSFSNNCPFPIFKKPLNARIAVRVNLYRRFEIAMLLVCLFAFISDAILAQTELYFKHFTDADGLSHYQTLSVYEDHKGVFWIGTADGLNRFDGGKFTAYYNSGQKRGSICGNAITNVTENAQHELLVGTTTGISVYNAGENTFRTVYTPTDLNPTDNLIRQVFVAKDGKVWISFRFSLLVLSPDYKVIKKLSGVFYKGDDVFRLLEDASGNIWVNSSGFLHKIDPRRNFSVESKANSTRPIYQKEVSDFDIDTKGRFFLSGLKCDSLWRFDKANELPVVLPSPGIANVHWLRLYSTSNETLWLTSEEHGVFRYAFGKWDIKELVHDEKNPLALCSNKVVDIAEDAYGNTWFCTSEGLDMLVKGILSANVRYEIPIALSERSVPIGLTCFANDGVNTWIGTWGKGIFKIPENGALPLFLSPSTAAKDLFITDIATIKNTVWVSNYSGCFNFNSNSNDFNLIDAGKRMFEPGNMPAVWKINEAANGDVWLSFTDQNGLLHINSRNGFAKHYTQKKEGDLNFPFRNYSAWAQANENEFYFGYNRSRGIVHFNAKNEHFEYLPENNPAYFDQQINCLLNDGHFLWIGNNSGICRIDRQTGQRIYLSRENGLPGNLVNALEKDHRGFIWAGLERGLIRINPATLAINNFDLNGLCRGINIKKLKFNAAVRVMECLSDYTYFSFALPEDNKLMLNRRPFVWACSISERLLNVNLPEGIKFSENDGVFRILFSCGANPALGKPRFSYLLKGYDANWHPSGDANEAVYASLPPGHYNLIVRASFDGVHWVESANALAIKVEPLFYKSTWFIVLMVLLPVAVVLAFLHLRNRIRLKNMLDMQTMRNRIAADLHDDIGSTLSSISIMSEVAGSMVEKDPKKSVDMLQKIGKHSRQLLSEMSDIVWSVNPDYDNAESMLGRMNDFAASILQDRGIRFVIESDFPAEGFEFTPQNRKNIYLIFKEALNNAVKHAECTEIKINFHFNDKAMNLHIIDNGKGFNLATARKGNGLKNIFKRAHQMGAKIKIDAENGKGTAVQLTLQLKD